MDTRRSFLYKSAAAATALSLQPVVAFSQPRSAAASSLRVGLIGVGLRGANHLRNLLQRDDVEVPAICDTDPERIRVATAMIQEAGKPRPKTFGEHAHSYRDLLALENVDAVVISTPWLWHTPIVMQLRSWRLSPPHRKANHSCEYKRPFFPPAP